MIRLVLTAIYVALFLIFTIPLMIVCAVMRKFNPSGADKLANSTVMWGFRSVSHVCGIRLEVRGAEKVPKDGALLYVANHRSLFDIVVGYPLCKCPTGVIAKKSTAKIPLLNIWMVLLRCLFLDRSNTKKGLQVILDAIEMVKTGTSILVFPEGTRNKDLDSDKLLPMHNGSFKVATKGNVLIQPMAIVGTDHIMKKHLMKGSFVIVQFCDPVDPKSLDKETLKNIGGYVGGIIEKAYAEIKADWSPTGH